MKHAHLDSIEIYVQCALDLFGPAQRTTAAQNVSDLEGPLQHDATTAVHRVPKIERLANSPWVIEQLAAIVSERSLSQLEGLLRHPETRPRNCNKTERLVWRSMRRRMRWFRRRQKPFSSGPKGRYPSYWGHADGEVPAEVCGQCNGHKKSPKGNRLAWRGIFGSWMVIPKAAPIEDPPEEELDHGEQPATEHATKTENGPPGSQATHQTIGGIPTPLAEDWPTAKRKQGRPRSSTNIRSRPRSESPTGPPLRCPRHLGEYWGCTAEQRASLSLEGKHGLHRRCEVDL
jgi:hypothetical protein